MSDVSDKAFALAEEIMQLSKRMHVAREIDGVIAEERERCAREVVELRDLVALKNRQFAECTKVMREVATVLSGYGHGEYDMSLWEFLVLADRLMAARAGV